VPAPGLLLHLGHYSSGWQVVVESPSWVHALGALELARRDQASLGELVAVDQEHGTEWARVWERAGVDSASTG
jgi:hypothetical protein